MKVNNSNFTFYKNKKNNLINFGTSLKGFPNVVEAGISRICNIRCHYCPNTFLKKNPDDEIMQWSLFIKILKNLKRIDYDGKFQFHRYNEPLYSKVKVEKYINAVKKYLPNAKAELVTNGSLLTRDRLIKLQKTGVNKIIVTQHTPKGFIDKLKKIPNYLLRNVDVRYGDELLLANRAGSMGKLEAPIEQPCYAINNSFVINSNGKVPLCADDYKHLPEVCLGDINENSIEEIWNSEYAQKIRNELNKGNRKYLELCKDCNRTSDIRNEGRYSKNNVVYRKKLLLTKGNAHLSQKN